MAQLTRIFFVPEMSFEKDFAALTQLLKQQMQFAEDRARAAAEREQRLAKAAEDLEKCLSDMINTALEGLQRQGVPPPSAHANPYLTTRQVSADRTTLLKQDVLHFLQRCCEGKGKAAYGLHGSGALKIDFQKCMTTLC